MHFKQLVPVCFAIYQGFLNFASIPPGLLRLDVGKLSQNPDPHLPGECGAVFALTFFLTIIVNIALPVLIYFLRFF